MIKLYGIPASRAFCCLWMLEELGVPYQNVPTNFATGETRTAEFLKLNPNGHIPVLVDDTLVLWESMAINLYLARRYGAGTLWPSNVADEGRAYQWSFWAMTEVEPAALALLLHRRLFPEGKRDEAKAREGEAKLGVALGVLEGALRGTPYLLGDSFTVADLNVAAVLTWLAMVQFEFAKFPQTAAWLARCTERPACGKARG